MDKPTTSLSANRKWLGQFLTICLDADRHAIKKAGGHAPEAIDWFHWALVEGATTAILDRLDEA